MLLNPKINNEMYYFYLVVHVKILTANNKLNLFQYYEEADISGVINRIVMYCLKHFN